VRMRHLPTGREFVCGGSEWADDGGLLLYTREELVTKGEKEPDAHGFVMYSASEFFALEFEPFRPDEIVRATECLLLSRWPVVCCRPRRRRKRKSAVG
jgi:hypothetical protein